MAYIAQRPPLHESIEELRARIPGWGVDIDPRDRPSAHRLLPVPDDASTDLPERQPVLVPRERSIEHAFLTPVFGTTCPTKGVSGAMRRYAYLRFSEARAAHWLLLLLADRVDATGSHLRSLVTRRPDNPITETGLRSELTHHGLTARLRSKRSDRVHGLLDPVIVAGPWLAGGVVAYVAAKRVGRIVTRSKSGREAWPLPAFAERLSARGHG